MGKYIAVFSMCILLFSFGLVFSRNIQTEKGKTGTPTLLVEGFGSDKGDAKIALCNSIESYENDEKASSPDYP